MPFITTRATAGTDATVKGLPLTNAEIDGNFIAINDGLIATGDLTGFVDKTQSTISFDSATRTLTLTPVSGSYVVYHKGKKKTISSTLTLQIANSEGGHWITMNATTGTLQDSGSFIDLTSYILVAYVYWSVGYGAIIAGDERHSAARDTTEHLTKHLQVGAVWRSGGDLTYTLNNQSSVSVTMSNIFLDDEDIYHYIQHAASANGYYTQVLAGTGARIPVLYRNGSGNPTQITATSNIPWIAGTSRARYNPLVGASGSLTDAPEGSYINYWIIATNDMLAPIKAIMGHNTYTTLLDALNETFDTMLLPWEETAAMYQVTLKTSTTYTNNAARVVIASVRKISGISNQLPDQNLNGYDHSGFSGLSDDDHLQYVHISTARTITAAHTWSGVQTFTNGIRINTKPTLNVEGTNKSYTDNRALITALMLS